MEAGDLRRRLLRCVVLRNGPVQLSQVAVDIAQPVVHHGQTHAQQYFLVVRNGAGELTSRLGDFGETGQGQQIVRVRLQRTLIQRRSRVPLAFRQGRIARNARRRRRQLPHLIERVRLVIHDPLEPLRRQPHLNIQIAAAGCDHVADVILIEHVDRVLRQVPRPEELVLIDQPLQRLLLLIRREDLAGRRHAVRHDVGVRCVRRDHYAQILVGQHCRRAQRRRLLVQLVQQPVRRRVVVWIARALLQRRQILHHARRQQGRHQDDGGQRSVLHRPQRRRAPQFGSTERTGVSSRTAAAAMPGQSPWR